MSSAAKSTALSHAGQELDPHNVPEFLGHINANTYSSGEAASRLGMTVTDLMTQVQNKTLSVPTVRIKDQLRFSKEAVQRLSRVESSEQD